MPGTCDVKVITRFAFTMKRHNKKVFDKYVLSFVHFQASSPSKSACCASGKDIISGHPIYIQNVN